MTMTPKTYVHCPRKHAARETTIIELYQNLRGPSIPEDKQYWSMCAQCANKDGIIEGSELDQIVKAGLIKPEQFHGVDTSKEIYDNNSLYPVSHWYKKDFLLEMKLAQEAGRFNPEIVNADLLNMPEIAAKKAGQILGFLSDFDHTDAIVVLNVVLKSHNRYSNVESLQQELCKDQFFRIVWSKGGWKIADNHVYIYHGTQPNKPFDSDAKNPKTIMCTIIFVPTSV